MNYKLLLFVVFYAVGLIADSTTLAQDIRSCSIPDPNPLTTECTDCPTKVLWVMCAADSAAIVPYDSLVFGKLDTCESPNLRAEYPTTYRMPSWVTYAFNPADERSVTRYFLDQSYGAKQVTGQVIGATDSTIFLCDSNIWLEPSQCLGHLAGSAFVTNIMGKVDSSYDLADFLSDPDDESIFVFLNIYGHAESRMVCCDGSGNPYLYTFTSAGAGSGGIFGYTSPTDINIHGDSIRIRGITGWTDSEEWLTGRVEGGSNPTLASYWQGIGMFAHEFGHDLGLMHTFNEQGGDDYMNAHIPTGSFDIMSYSPAFWDKTNFWFRGQPSPYNPVSRMRILHWIEPLVIDRPQFEIQIGDNLMGGSAVKLPAYVNPATDPYDDADGQYFVAIASTRESLWERWMPSDGVMIYHYNENGDQTKRGNKIYDMELPTGQFDWTIRNEFDGWQFVPTGENTYAENTVTGLDSFDFRFFHNDSFLFNGEPMPIPQAEYVWAGEHASPGNYWVAGDTFDGNSNPSTDAYTGTNNTNNPQSLPTNAGLAVISVDAVNHVTTVSAWSRHWRGAVSENVTWLDSIVVDSSISVASSANLTILPGTTIVLDAGATITINGTLTALGTTGDPIVFRSKDVGEKWKGIEIASGGSVEMDYVDLWNYRDYGISTDGPAAPVSYNHVNLNCSDLKAGGKGIILLNSPTVTQTVKNTHVYSVAADSEATGLYLYNCKVDFDSVTIEDCDFVNSQIKKVTGSFHGCTFKDRTEGYGIYFNTTPNTPNFRCCEFTNLAPNTQGFPQATIYCATGTTPSFGAEGDTDGEGVSNTIKDSSAYLMIMQGTVNYPIIDSYGPQIETNGGKNNWKQTAANGKFFQRSSMHLTQFPCTEQYWSPSFNLSLFSPAVAQHWKYSPVHSTDWQTCGGGEGGGQGDRFDDGAEARDGSGMLDDVNYDSLYAEATVFENNEDYAAAQQLFRHIAENTSQTALRWNAITHVVACESFVQQGSSWVASLIAGMIELEDRYDTGVLGERLLASYYQNRAEYDQAIETGVALLSSGLTYEDSIQVAMDLVGIQLSMDGGGGRLDGAGASLIPTTLRARDDEHALAIERELMGLLNPAMNEETQTAEVPTEFSLSQNYPNPFNPETVIEFALPIAGKTTLKVFDVTGREVATLIDETLTAGHHRVNFDGSRLASGVYFYSLKAGEQAMARKMVLLK